MGGPVIHVVAAASSRAHPPAGRTPTGWDAFSLGADGKRGPLGIVVPDFIAADELREYLADIFHEAAQPGNGDVVELP